MAVGTYRILKLCKYLPEHGWTPVVLTVGDNWSYLPELAPRGVSGVKTLRAQRWRGYLPSSKVDKTHRREPPLLTGEASNRGGEPRVSANRTGLKQFVRQRLKTWLNFPDQFSDWIIPAIIEGFRAIPEVRPTLIVSSSPPVSCHLVSLVLSAASGVPMVCDFRDLWTDNESYDLRHFSRWQSLVDASLEGTVLRKSRAVTSVTETFLDTLRSKVRGAKQPVWKLVANGVDPEDFLPSLRPKRTNPKFKIVHLGNLYGHRDPAIFLRIVREWLQRHPEVRSRVEICFRGDLRDVKAFERFEDLASVLRIERPTPRSEGLALLSEADLLLLMLGYQPSSGGVIPAKLFEYVVVKRPILAFVPEGEAANLIRKYDRGLVISSPDDEKMAIPYLTQAFEQWAAQGPQEEESITIPQELTRRFQTAEFARALDAVGGRSSNRPWRQPPRSV
jgi:glycosyltransferase involved in cell wall biosynthesis